MAAMPCEEIIKKHLGRDFLTEDELARIAADARAMSKKARAGVNAADLGRSWQRSRQSEIKMRMRNAWMSARARSEAVDYAMTFKGREAEGLSALLTGSKWARDGARRSVDNIAGSMKDEYFGMLDNAIFRLGKEHYTIFKEGRMDQHIAEAMFLIDTPDAYAGPVQAMEIAKAIRPLQEMARARANNAGAYIQKLDGFITSQSHDQLRIHKAGPEKWKADAEALLDWEKTADGRYLDASTPEARAERDGFLEHVYKNLATGNHRTTQGISPRSDPMATAGRIGSTAAKLSKHRVLHFKSGKDWWQYNQKYGHKSLAQSIVAGLEKTAQDTALMRVFGPSPQQTLRAAYDDVLARLRDTGQLDAHNRASTKWGHLENRMKALDGTLNMIGNPTLAQAGAIFRAIKSMASLGMAVISGLADAPTVAFERKWQGHGYFESFAKLVWGLWGGRGTIEQREVLAQCGVFFDAMRGQISGRFAGDVGPGAMSRMLYHYFNWNGLSFWTDVWKKSFCLQMSHDIAGMAGRSWAGLSKEARRMLSLYKLAEGKWEMLRGGRMRAADGRSYFTAELADQMDDAAVKAYMKAKGMKISDARVAQFKEEVAGDIRAMFRDRTRYAMLEPDAETNALLTQGFSSGTVPGEAIRLMMQFKQFPTLYLQRTWARELYGRGAQNGMEAARQMLPFNKSGELSMIPAIMLGTTMFGYFAMSAKEILAGKMPRNPIQAILEGDWEQVHKIALASALQGGGLGIYGDFLFGSSSRFGNSFWATAGGPAGSAAEDLLKLMAKVRDGEDPTAHAIRFVKSLTPYQNLFYAKPALDYFFWNELCEWANPGFLKRMRDRVRNENHQEYWLPESQMRFGWKDTGARAAAIKQRQRDRRAERRAWAAAHGG